ncbi:ExeA family protein [Vibrio algarum]|uniref:AAA family ATPase n=1 Tax=Vibrio algarum TaxID=3020714 RepID=A0ABT4YNG3_9VIBR|nr:AAA family ATPase [Vibrio sp. KJ40-1]MDB1122957.1 AAA family ATPase [Vibrio sp. KJ40-1]
MYKDYFGFIEMPFSIVPSSRYLFLSSRHREAMGHLQAGLGDGGGFAMLTGEVGTGKTTVSKAMLASLNDDVKAGLILNPTFSENDLLEAICDEFNVKYPENATLKQLTKGIHQYLLENHAKGIQSLLLIDEAQHLSTQVLEQLRLLTNLETDSQKLLKVLLIGQPELQAKLQTAELRQLAQRITGRYHLLPLSDKEVEQYVEFRLQIAGAPRALFSVKALKVIAKYSQGIPRLINLVCDKALLYAYYSGEQEVSVEKVEKACQDVMSFQAPLTQQSQSHTSHSFPSFFSAIMLAIILVGLVFKFNQPIETFVQSHLTPLPVYQSKIEKQESIDDVLADFIKQSQNPINATQILYGLWGIKASVLDADCSLNNAPFYCETRYGNLQSVVAEKRPVVLSLNSEFGDFYAVLYKVYDDKIELINGSQRVLIATDWLNTNWNGEYQTLWYSEIDQVLKINSNGNSVEKLDLLLAKVLGDERLNTRVFNATLENRVKAFQTWQGLSADGVVGKNTLKLLDRMTTEFAPEIILIKEEG